MTTSTITPTSTLELLGMLGRLIRDAVDYPGRERDLENLRKVYALHRAEDPRWVEFLTLWIKQTPSERCAAAAKDILVNHDARQAEQAKANFLATRPARTSITQDGMYRTADGQIFKVQWNRGEGDGKRLYAKQMVGYGAGGRVTEFTKANAELHDDLSISFEYAPGAMKWLTAEDRMTMEDAKEFGALYGTCVRCGRTLTLEESIERAMGRKCAGKI